MIISDAAKIALQHLGRPAKADEIHKTILLLKLMTEAEVSTSEGVRVKIEILCENSNRTDKPSSGFYFTRVSPATYDLLDEFKKKATISPQILAVISRKRRLNR
ncbi:hypothetical protein J8L86_09460 [Shewanella sp. MMG014]|uniref:hypothetical protein n=1 Tax=Shewanella sp. MMG014 TaxID=2822691 RepID=UPI001B375678|nr:hypothetical protein [Shewanella sp. MMG014]MBQ4890066.1 hypothetical protein [Shewanella sp. MMG014]